jgi:hypothetical protein
MFRASAVQRTSAAILAIGATLWALAIGLLGGFHAGAIAATDPVRPLIVAAAAAMAYLAMAGIDGARRDFRRHGARFITPLAIVLAASPAIVGLARNSWTAGGADAYAYVSQADRWLQFRLKTPLPIAASAPWPDAINTFAPHGYRPSTDGTSLVPVTAPGLPLLMAAAKFIAGHCAMFWVTPLSGALLVWMTFAIGRRLGSTVIGLAAAWLVATSPAVLAMLVSPMSDVPAAAFWTAALCFALPRSPDQRGATGVAPSTERYRMRDALLCGFAAGMAILIRPNLAPLAIVIVTILIIRIRADAVRLKPVAGAVAVIAAACLFIGWINNRLYGSPLTSGYGGITTLFSFANVLTNFRRYGGWLMESQTPLALLGLAALAAPLPILWPTAEWRRAARAMAAMVVIVWALYLAYTPFDAWWYLRFLLPAWPAMCLGSAALLAPFLAARRPAARGLAFGVLAAVGLHGIRYAATHGAFPSGEGDHRYVSIATLAAEYTDSSSIILAAQYAGPTRYYGGRMTLRFDVLDPAWLDRAAGWMAAHGHHPYILLEEYEIPLFQQRFAGNTLGALAFAPVLAYHAPGVPGSVYLFDPLRPGGPTLRPAPPLSTRRKCVEPAPEPLLN